ncbi:MAG: hypothetical protein AABX70_03120 [Nanoarchaeota archaeon]
MKLHVYYDEFGDYLEIYTGNHKQHEFINLTGDTFELKNKTTRRTEGFAIHAFRKQAKELLKVKGVCFHYDEPGDLLEVGIGKPVESYLKNLGEGVFLRTGKSGEAIGLAIQGLKERTKKTLEAEIVLPQEIELSSKSKVLIR